MKTIFVGLFVLLSFTTLEAQSTDRQMFLEAKGRFERGDYDYSQVLLSQFLRSHPLSIWKNEAQILLGIAYYQQGQLTQALDHLEALNLETFPPPDRLRIQYWRARVLLETGEAQKALDLLGPLDSQEIKSQGIAPSLLLLQGRTNLALSQFPQGVDALEREISSPEDPDYPYALELSLHGALALEKWDQVLSLLEDQELSSKGKLYLAEAFRGLGQEEKALALYEELIDSSLSVALIAHQRLIQMALDDGDLAQAEDRIARAETAFAQEPEVLRDFWRRIGIASYQAGEEERAQRFLGKIWEGREKILPDDLSAYYLSRLLYDQGEIDRSLEMILELNKRKTSPLSLELKILWSRILLEKGELSQALDLLGALLKDYPEDPHVPQWVYLLAWIHGEKGQGTVALEYLQDQRSPSQGHPLYFQSLRLRAQVHRRLGQNTRALEFYDRYLALQPEDPQAQSEALTILFEAKNYTQVISRARANTSRLAPWKNSNPGAYFSHQYQWGLALVAVGQYAGALEILEPLGANTQGGEDFLPFSRFYAALAVFRLDNNQWQRALGRFQSLLQDYPGHQLEAQILFWSGWTALFGGDHPRAQSYFRRYSIHPRARDRNSSLYYLSRSLSAQGQKEEALRVLEGLITQIPATTWVPQSRFDKAKILEDLERFDQALGEFRSLAQGYPEHELAQEALIQRASLLMKLERWEQAGEAFREYRKSFPNGQYADLAYYQEALASKNSNSPFQAILALQDLVRLYPSSNYTGTALWEIAGLFESQGNLPQAMEYYQLLGESFPELARSLDVGSRIETLNLRSQGYTEEEARLQVAVATGRRATTPEGRQAMVSLARLYIFGQSANLETARILLEEVLKAIPNDRVLAPQAQYLLGEYHERMGEYLQAGNSFYAVLQLRPQDRDLSAQSLYRAAQMILLAGNRNQAATLIDALKQNFPGTIWAERGEQLLGGKP